MPIVPAHERADTLIRALHRHASTLAGEDPRALAEELLHGLPAHLEAEERPDGLFDRLAAAGADRTVARLHADHAWFREQLSTLSDVAPDPAATFEVLRALSARLREHERLEAAAARRIGAELPSSREEEAPAELPPALHAHLEALASEVVDRTRTEPGRLLSRLSVTLPDDAPWAACLECLERELAARGLDFVDLVPVRRDGPPSVLEAGFEAGWAD